MARTRVDDLEAQFGERVRRVRRTAGVSQVELARVANVSRSAVVNLEAGAGSSLATVVKVLDALDRTDWLLSLDGEPEPFNPLDLLEDSSRQAGSGRGRR